MWRRDIDTHTVTHRHTTNQTHTHAHAEGGAGTEDVETLQFLGKVLGGKYPVSLSSLLQTLTIVRTRL